MTDFTRLNTNTKKLSASRTLRRQQLELYEFQANEIDAVDLVPGQWVDLNTRYTRLRHLERIKRDTDTAYTALHESDGSILERLHMASKLLDDLAKLDGHATNLAQQVRTATWALQESAHELRQYADRLEVDPSQLADVEDRLNTLNRLAAKYTDQQTPATSDDPADALIKYRQKIDGELQRLHSQNEDLDILQNQTVEVQQDLQKIGNELGAMRRKAAQKLKPLIEKELAELGMGDAQFEVAFESMQPASRTGLDRVEMLIQTNPGQPARPLRMIASGGETSRMMLAIKSILAHRDRVSVLVFDEIDANIGGRMGTVIGTKLRRLARGSSSHKNPSQDGKNQDQNQTANHSNDHQANSCDESEKAVVADSKTHVGMTSRDDSGGHQILCITHLPQIAAFADRHFHITKTVIGPDDARQSHTKITVLNRRSRVNELAEMLVGQDVTVTSRKQAREMLEAATS